MCAEGGAIVQQLAKRISEEGGAALIADYGHDGTKTDTFRVRTLSSTLLLLLTFFVYSQAFICFLFVLVVDQGFKGHQLHDVLKSPGSADLTTDVDFSYLRSMAAESVTCLGPIAQRMFLKNMGIDARMQVSQLTAVDSEGPRVQTRRRSRSSLLLPLQVLWKSCSHDSTRQQLVSSYDLMMNPAKMGQRFLFFSLLHHGRLAPPTPPPPPSGLKLEKRQRPAPLPVAGFSELSYS